MNPAGAGGRVRALVRLLPVSVVLLLGPAPLVAQGKDYVRLHYTKQEVRIPMRDGVRLFTTIYVPRDAGKRTSYPILLTRTPYGVAPYGDEFRDSLGPSEAATRDRFIFVYQDVRGRMMSEGTFVDVRPLRTAGAEGAPNESTDASDTVEWLTKNVSGNNGRVGIWGISYPGFYASMALIDAHPAVVAVSPQAPIADWFLGDDFRHNGALFLPHAFNFYSSFGRPQRTPTTKPPERFDHGTADGYAFFLRSEPLRNLDGRYLKGSVPFWNEMLEHETYDQFWQERSVKPHLRNVRPAVLTVGGWFDAEDLYGTLATFKAIEQQSPGTSNRLVMGPWSHGGWAWGTGEALGRVHFGQLTSRQFQEEIELPFWRYHLKGVGGLALPEARVFLTGRDEWRSFDAWPPPKVRQRAFYFREEGLLAAQAPAETEGFDEYVSDPRKPVPFSEDVSIGMTVEYMVDDQRFASRRPDVLVYETPSLTEELTVAGPVGVTLHVSTTGTDSDFVVKLIDVYPDDFSEPQPPGTKRSEAKPPGVTKMGGYQQLVRGEPFRGRFRRSFEKPEPFVPGEVARIAFEMPDVLHCFRKGHRVMVQVQSTWFPLVDLNPQRFVSLSQATEKEFQKATQRVYRTRTHPSFIELGVLP